MTVIIAASAQPVAGLPRAEFSRWPQVALIIHGGNLNLNCVMVNMGRLVAISALLTQKCGADFIKGEK
jgi:hypothetical protein